jgi:AcrR family transcriptional regulator
MFTDSGARAVPQRAGSLETRQRIVETALALFREHGFDPTTIRDIARAAGLSLGAAYYYFPSKDAIVAAYYDYVQEEHLARAAAAYAAHGSLRDRLRAAFHTKIDVVEADRALLRALFRHGGDPGHPLSWFGPATRDQREKSTAVFAAALEGERLPDDVRSAAPVLLWTLHMGVLLYFLYDDSPGYRRTRRLIDASVDFAVDVKRLATSALLRPLRRRVISILRDAGLLGAAA